MKKRDIFIVVLIISILLLIVFVLFIPKIIQPNNENIDDNSYWHHHMMGGYGMMGGWMVIPAVLIGIILFSLYMIIIKNDKPLNRNEDEPLSILNRKYVNGEISEEEYLQKKKNIHK